MLRCRRFEITRQSFRAPGCSSGRDRGCRRWPVCARYGARRDGMLHGLDFSSDCSTDGSAYRSSYSSADRIADAVGLLGL